MMRQMQRKARRRGEMPLLPVRQAQVFGRVGKPLPTSFNSGVPQHVVQKLLGHASPHMTAHYARVHDTTIREAFDNYQRQRVNIAGQPLGYDPDAPTAAAEWVKHNLSRIRDSLPNGYCGRPPQQDCPHPNAP
jgi:hypothetical protein